MSQVLTALFFCIVIVGLLFLIAAVVQNTRKRREDAWRRVADSRGIDFFPGSWTSGPSMAGSVHGFFVSVDTQQTGENEKVTRYSVAYPSTGRPAIGLSKQSSLHFTLVKRVLGKTDVEIGDPTFDDRVLIDASDPVSAARYLSPVRRHAVLQLFGAESFKNPRVSDTAVVVETVGVESDAHNLDRVVEILLHTARTMSEPTDVDLAAPPPPPPPSVPPPLSPAPSAPSPVDAPAPIQDEVRIDPPKVEIPVEPDMAPEPASTPEPEAVPPEPTPESASAVQPVAESVEAPPVDLSQHAVATDLFGSGRMGFETTAHFEDTYAGAEIHWSGEVDRVRDHRGDSDFDQPGTKVTMLLGANGGSALRSGQPKAIVQFPVDTTMERGDHVTFTGTLLRCDRYTRSVYIADGRTSD